MPSQTPQPLNDAPPPPASQRLQLLRDWNDTSKDYPLDICLHQLVEQQARRTPDPPAVCFEEASLSYRQLNARANQLAQHLISLGVGHETRVGIFGERSLEIVIGFLAILKAGGAYVPIDADDPVERIAFVLQDADIAVLLTQEHLVTKLPDIAKAVICLDRDWPEIALAPDEQPDVEVRPDQLAYVIYTSGSTGRPKGARNLHRAICNRLLWMQDQYQLNADDRILQKTPFSFDVSGWELFWPLINGATMVLARPGGHRDSAYLVHLIREQQITRAHFVPSMLRAFLSDPHVGRCTTLRQVICSGEELPFELQRRFFERLSAHLDNLYGPTEAAIDVSYWRCDSRQVRGPIPIGRPIANVQLYILDASLSQVPIGFPGELHIGGIQVGDGYHNRPELTAEKFIPDPFAPETENNRRLYKTGDLACYREDGAIEFLGRIDHQVKISGFRIELGEIDAEMTEVPEISNAVTVAHERGDGDKRLVTYLVPSPMPDSGAALSHATLTEAAKARAVAQLPAHMHPSAYVVLPELPLTPSGKVDRKALPAPVFGNAPDPRSAQTRSRVLNDISNLESYLVALWCDTLKRDHVEVDEKFFELGGTSLLAAQLINALQEKLQEQIFVVTLFEAPTVAQFTDFLYERYPDAVARHFSVPLNRNGARRPIRNPPQPIAAPDLEHLQNLLGSSGEDRTAPVAKNPPAIFILSTHRSGTTLLRSMLAGHPRLFAASELQLLEFDDMAARRDTFQGARALWLEGAIRTVMEIHRCDAASAQQMIAEYEEKATSTQAFFHVLQEQVAPRTLVDKSPSYSLDPGALRRAEAYFEDAIYIHLVRHPLAMVRSSENFHMQQVWGIGQHPYSDLQLAELIWTLSHRNILNFLSSIPAARQIRVQFEQLVGQPRETMDGLCRVLGIDFHDDLLEPYKEKERKMLDGIHPESMPMGDTHFHGYEQIEAAVAQKWMNGDDGGLADMTLDVAEQLGYARPVAVRKGLGAQRKLRRRHRNED
jgi:amino acid adenylation domain-containing protein